MALTRFTGLANSGSRAVICKGKIAKKSAWVQRVISWLLNGLLLSSALLQSSALRAEPIAVRHPEGTTHGFLVLHTADGKTLAAGDLVEVVEGDRLVSNLIFHFKDGSIDDDTTVVSQRRDFRLLRDHHVQKGPSFPHPMDVLIDATKGEVTVHSTDGGKTKVDKDHLDLPPDLSNGLLLTIVKNLQPGAAVTKVGYVAATPKPRLVKLSISPAGEETFWAADAPHKATRYDIKVEIGGVAGVLAPLLGKQPKDIQIWVLRGKAPAFIRMEGQLYQGGPIWTIELTSPVWQKPRHSGR